MMKLSSAPCNRPTTIASAFQAADVGSGFSGDLEDDVIRDSFPHLCVRFA